MTIKQSLKKRLYQKTYLTRLYLAFKEYSFKSTTISCNISNNSQSEIYALQYKIAEYEFTPIDILLILANSNNNIVKLKARETLSLKQK